MNIKKLLFSVVEIVLAVSLCACSSENTEDNPKDLLPSTSVTATKPMEETQSNMATSEETQITLPDTSGGAVHITYDEYMLLTDEQKETYEDSFASSEDYEAWFDEIITPHNPTAESETQAESSTEPSLPVISTVPDKPNVPDISGTEATTQATTESGEKQDDPASLPAVESTNGDDADF